MLILINSILGLGLLLALGVCFKKWIKIKRGRRFSFNQEQIAQAEKMINIGTMADGLAHQINNRFYALSLITGDTIDTIKATDTTKCSPEIQEMLKNINYALERIQANVAQGSEVVKGIIKYARKGDSGLGVITLDQVLDAALEMLQYKVKLDQIDFIYDSCQGLPKIKGNPVQLQEVFFNLIDNACDSINERKALLNEPGYKGRITISAQPKSAEVLEIVVADNGMGVKESEIKNIFTPFFTTKISSRLGIGLGLYVSKRTITENHQGKISFNSHYQSGTRFIIELPILLA